MYQTIYLIDYASPIDKLKRERNTNEQYYKHQSTNSFYYYTPIFWI
jgi:hypothetical protein